MVGGGRPEAAFASSVALAPKEQAAAKERMLAGTPAKLSQGLNLLARSIRSDPAEKPIGTNKGRPC
jgi:hypothetical protein